MPFDNGSGATAVKEPLGFAYAPDSFGPTVERRSLDSIRASLRDPACQGPNTVYAIAMDVGRIADRVELLKRQLLFGAVAYATGSLGQEPIRSQGHVHRVSQHSGWSPPEFYEIWEGQAVIYLQEHAAADPGRCYAVEAGPGDVVIVPPGWAHATISADPRQGLAFGACCDREYGFEYDALRALGGIAHFPLLKAGGGLDWERNPAYASSRLSVSKARNYEALGLRPGIPIYRQFQEDPEMFQCVSEPSLKASLWKELLP